MLTRNISFHTFFKSRAKSQGPSPRGSSLFDICDICDMMSKTFGDLPGEVLAMISGHLDDFADK